MAVDQIDLFVLWRNNTRIASRPKSDLAEVASQFHLSLLQRDASGVEHYEVLGKKSAPKRRAKSGYKSASARDAQRLGVGSKSYWDYLDEHAKELASKGVADAMTRTLAESLRGNDGI